MLQPDSDIDATLNPCPDCGGDGYVETFNEDQSGVVTNLCERCDGSGAFNPFKHFYDGTEYEGFYD